MSRFNAKASIKNLGAANFGFFEFDLLDKIAKVVEPRVGQKGYFRTNPLCVDGVNYVQQPEKNGYTFGLTPMMQAAQAHIKAIPAMSITDMRPLKEPESVELCHKLYLEMMQQDGSINWNLLQQIHRSLCLSSRFVQNKKDHSFGILLKRYQSQLFRKRFWQVHC